jgi:type I restriction enzyme M protein
MRHFATESGKSKGQFYTPAEVSRVMAKVVGITGDTEPDDTLYDPTCGSGSLLLKANDEAPDGLSIYGQEMDTTTQSLAQMNMILHDNPTAQIEQGNTLASPHWTNGHEQLKRFDFAVANPPFSYKSWTNGVDVGSDSYGRFELGTPPSRNGDYAFLLHIITSLKSTGKAAVVMPHGVLFRGNSEKDIRRNLVQRGYIRGIIGLPDNLFYGTGIPACIVVLDKEHAARRDGVFIVDASAGYRKDGNKNRLRERDIHKIVDVFNSRREIEGYSRFVPAKEIKEHDYNLNIPRYIDAVDEEDAHDLEGHLQGGIPNGDLDDLGDYWDELPSLRADLFQTLRPGYSELQVPTDAVKETILEHPDFQTFAAHVRSVTQQWREAHEERLCEIDDEATPSKLIETISEDLLDRFEDVPLLDRYDIYQRLMEFWQETMQDDVFVIVQDGWTAGRDVHTAREHEEPDCTFKEGRSKREFVGELIPPQLIVDRFFPEEKERMEELQAEYDAATQAKEQFEEEHSAEGEVLDGLEGKSGSVTKGNVKDRVQELKKQALNVFDPMTPEYQQADSITKTNFGTREWQKGREDAHGIFAELDVLYDYLHLDDEESTKRTEAREARATLYRSAIDAYDELSVATIKELVVEDKWMATVEEATQDEVRRVTQHLTSRIRDLQDRYEQPLPDIEQEVEERSRRVDEHLEMIG